MKNGENVKFDGKKMYFFASRPGYDCTGLRLIFKNLLIMLNVEVTLNKGQYIYNTLIRLWF